MVKPVVQVLNGGKPTFASKLRESVEREAKARRGVEAGRPDFDWEDKVSEDEEEEGGVEAEEEEEGGNKDVVEPTVQTTTPTPTPVKVVPATQPVRKVFVATPFEPTPISRGWVRKYAQLHKDVSWLDANRVQGGHLGAGATETVRRAIQAHRRQ